ncbi:FAD:protein FMN transferase [Desulfoluna limicola]|uniref:FAD:protein FMN transferase n=2 Tax=Desulfoluna limicola TaxID=2810562 RepID=A0ABM7PMY6_9BACT|nr:FAD:protein FMN transferase [Desulfoluna limicola]
MKQTKTGQAHGKISRNKLLMVIMVALGIFALVVAAGVTTGFNTKQEVVLSGRTMGTTYHIKAVVSGKMSADALGLAVTKRLDAINRSMSVYDPHSEISRFNRADKGTLVPVSADLLTVFLMGERIHKMTGGAWDATVGPLVNLWGFGPGKAPEHLPDDAAVEKALARVGYGAISMKGDGHLVKKRAGLFLDFGSIAKGYGVDAVASLLREKNIRHFLVEIGGEVYGEGSRIDGNPWRVGINTPQRGAAVGDLFQVRTLKGQALATSGDYRNFLEVGGRIWTHVIDPRSGRPVENGVTSVSVLADSAIFADGLATALMVMGPEAGLDLVNRLSGVECLLIVRKPDGGLAVYPSDTWVAQPQ